MAAPAPKSIQSKPLSARQIAFLALQAIQKGAFADVEIDRSLNKSTLNNADRRLVTELVYGSVRRQRTLDALIDQFGKKKAADQPSELRHILHLGFYQLRYLDHVPDHAVVSTTVELAKWCRLGKLDGVVNGMLRQYIRLAASHTPDTGSSERPPETPDSRPEDKRPKPDPLTLPTPVVQKLGILHSYPDWIIQAWQTLLPEDEIGQLCQWFNQSPSLDLRVNALQASVEQVQTALSQASIPTVRRPLAPNALRVKGSTGNIRHLPGYDKGHWMVQDSGAQLVSLLIDPQPGETIIDACAAPGGKTTQLAELMGDQGRVIGCDRTSSRTRKIQQNLKRLQLTSIETVICDSRNHPEFEGIADRVLLDVPCSGLGTLHRHADARWRQTPESVKDLVKLQQELLTHTATWVKSGGVLVYSTCTLHPDENEHQIQQFLNHHPHWQIVPPPAESAIAALTESPGWIKVWPHRQQMDGFFMVKLMRN